MKIRERFIEDMSEDDLISLNKELSTFGISETEFNSFYRFYDVYANSVYPEEAIQEFKERFRGIYYSAEDFVAEDLFECYQIPDFLEYAINYRILVTMLETGGSYSFQEVPEGCAVFSIG